MFNSFTANARTTPVSIPRAVRIVILRLDRHGNIYWESVVDYMYYHVESVISATASASLPLTLTEAPGGAAISIGGASVLALGMSIVPGGLPAHVRWWARLLTAPQSSATQVRSGTQSVSHTNTLRSTAWPFVAESQPANQGMARPKCCLPCIPLTSAYLWPKKSASLLNTNNSEVRKQQW